MLINAVVSVRRIQSVLDGAKPIMIIHFLLQSAVSKVGWREKLIFLVRCLVEESAKVIVNVSFTPIKDDHFQVVLFIPKLEIFGRLNFHYFVIMELLMR